MAVRDISSPLPAYPAGSSRLTVRPPKWDRRHRWAGLADPGPNRTINDGTVFAVAAIGGYAGGYAVGYGSTAIRGFTWPHGLGVVPASAHVDDPLSLPLPEFRTGWDATNVFVLFDKAPLRNPTLRWVAVAPDAGVVAPVVLVGEVLVTEDGLALLTEDGLVLLTEGRV